MMKKIKTQILKQLLTIYDYESKSQEEVADIIQHQIADFERTHDGYKFDKLIFGFDDKTPEQHFHLKFIIRK